MKPTRKRVSTLNFDNIEFILTYCQNLLDNWDYQVLEDCCSHVELFRLKSNSIPLDKLRRLLLLLARANTIFAQTNLRKRELYVNKARVFISEFELLEPATNSEIEAEKTALKAVIEYFSLSPDEALSLVERREDPYATRVRASIYLKQLQLTDALAVLEGREPHPHWCDLAVTIYGLNDRFEKALELVQWASEQPDAGLYPQCCVRFAQAGMARLTETHTEQPVQPESISPNERKRLEQILRVLEPVLGPIQAAGKPASELDLAALRCAMQAHHLLQNREEIRSVLQWMYQWTPVPIEVAQGMTSGYWEAPADLAKRLWDEHADDLDAGIMTVVILASAFQKPLEALERLGELVVRALTENQRNKVFRVAFQLRQNLEGDAAARCEAHMEVLAKQHPLNQSLLRAAQAVQSRVPDLAISLLDEHRAEDDFYWLQLRAKACLQRQEFKVAVRWLSKAYDLTRDARLLLLIADSENEGEDFETAAWSYEHLLVASPDDASLHGRLAHVYHAKLGDLERAATHFQALHELEPGNPVHTRNLALCLAQIFQPEDSLRLFDELCELPEPLMETVLGRAQLLLSLGQSDEALNSMEPFADRFRENVSFWAMMVQAGYASGQEASAERALVNLQRLQQASGAPNEAVRVIPQDAFLAWLKQAVAQSGEKDEQVHEQMLRGRMPWIWAAQIAGQPILAEWRRRTLPMAWLSENRINLARFTVYATNGFHAGLSSRGVRELMPIACPPRGTEIIADLSALITLHHLDLLETAAEYFGSILVPVAYLRTALEDARKMIPLQRTEGTSSARIERLVTDGLIEVMSGDSDQAAVEPGIPILDEYNEGVGHRYRFIDVLKPLHAAGRLNETQFAEISRLRQKPSGVDDAHPPLEQGQRVLVDLLTLHTLARLDAFDVLRRFFRFTITRKASQDLRLTRRSHTLQEELHAAQLDLFRRLRKDQRFKFVPHVIPQEMRQEDRGDDDYLPFWSVFVAQQRRLPLLADDRALQAFALNAMGDDPAGAFGTDAFVVALSGSGETDTAGAAHAWEKLIALRYRYLVPTAEQLKALAVPYKTNLPGVSLRRVATYVQDCMRDPGLFNGPEKTDAGESMAIRLYMNWVATVADFLVLVWKDEVFTEEEATVLTDWACRELLPALPLVLENPMKSRLGEWTHLKFVSQVLNPSVDVGNSSRMHQAMQAIRNALQLTNEAYERIVIETLRVSDRLQPGAERHRKILHQMQVDMMIHAFGPEGAVKQRTFVSLRDLDLTLPDTSTLEDAELLLAVLRDVKHPNRVQLPDGPPPTGPLLLFRRAEDHRIVQVDIAALMLSESLPLRLAAVERLLSENEGERLEMTAVTRRKLVACQAKLRGETPREWAPAALDAYDALQDDLLLSLQGAGQCVAETQFNSGTLAAYLDRILHPTETALKSIQSAVLDPGLEPDRLLASLQKLGNGAKSTREVCEKYYQALGHLPFAPEYSLAAVIGPWREKHPGAPLWDELRAWAHEARSPLAAYHACSVFVLHPEWIPAEKQLEFWQECLKVLRVADRRTDEPEENATWAMRHDLVRLLSQNLEALFPGSDSSRTALFAWWWAERVASRLTCGAQEAQQLRTNHIQPRLKNANHVRQLGASVVIRSDLRRMIKTYSFPWATALLALMGDHLPALSTEQLNPDDHDLLNQAIASCLIDTLPVAFDDPEAATFALEYPLGKVAQAWQELVKPDEERSLSGLLQASRDCGDAEGLAAALRRLPELPFVDRLVVTHALCNMAHAAPDVFSASIFGVLTDEKWRIEVLSKVDESILDRLIDGFSTLQASDPDRWSSTLPHCLAELCERNDDESRVRELVFYVLHASLLSDSVSAVRRLLHGENPGKYLKAVKEYRASIQGAWGLYPPWIQGRLRGLLANLYVE